MALSLGVASSASANWFIGGTELAAGKSAALSTVANVHASVVISLPAIHFKITCKGSTFTEKNPQIIAPNVGKAESLTIEGCETTEPATGCELQGKTVSIKTEPIIGTATLSGALADRITFAPQTGKTFAVIPLAESDTCSLVGEEPVKGSVTAAVARGQDEALSQLLETLGSVENNSLEVGAGNKGFLESGKALLRLASDSKWSYR